MIISMIEIDCIPADEEAFEMQMREELIIGSDTNLYQPPSSTNPFALGWSIGLLPSWWSPGGVHTGLSVEERSGRKR